MITTSDQIQHKQPVKAVGLISGGLDSILAAKIIKDLGFEVHGVYFAMPWGCCDKAHAMAAAENIGIKLITLQLDERYLEVVRSPKHGRGKALNPCVDCRIHMFSRAAQYMRHIGAKFVFTGEVLGQRPMSQKRESMSVIERNAGLEGRLLRPLSAQLLEPTQVERDHIVDRAKLLRLNGRSRKDQYRLADELNIDQFSAPAGGCLLTDQNFAKRMQDTLDHGYRNFRETIALQWGRHFRIGKKFKIVLGRDEKENNALTRYAHAKDIIMEYPNRHGPTLILKGDNPDTELLATCAGLIQHFSKRRHEPADKLTYWCVQNPNDRLTIGAKKITEDYLKKVNI